jgi:type II secretory pathway pseudopilin PulG
MNSQKQWGFTIIELILFLGITGMLFAGLMVGVNTSINTQRYKESAMGMKALFEEQYSNVEYPRNSRDGNWNCDAATGIVPNPSDGTPRGTSKCVLLGRYIEMVDNGAKIETGDVVGIEPAASLDGTSSDLEALTAYAPRKSPINVTTSDVGWDSRAETVSDNPSSASFLILRSPLSGIIRTFGGNAQLPELLSSSITDTTASSALKSCIIPAGYVSVPTYSLTVNAAVGSANGLVLNGDDSEC